MDFQKLMVQKNFSSEFDTTEKGGLKMWQIVELSIQIWRCK